MDRQSHWEAIHREKAVDAVSWYRPHLDTSLRLIEEVASGRSAAILDVGAGQSTLVDDLLLHGYEHITVLDIAQAALDGTRQRLGAGAAQVRWLVDDVTKAEGSPRRHTTFGTIAACFTFLRLRRIGQPTFAKWAER